MGEQPSDAPVEEKPQGALAALLARKNKKKADTADKKSKIKQDRQEQAPPVDDDAFAGLMSGKKAVKGRGDAHDVVGATAPQEVLAEPQWERVFRQEQAVLESEFGLEIKRMKADGACLFRSFAEQMHEDTRRHNEVREKCVEFMRKNRDDFQPFVEGNFDRYLGEMQRKETWGGDIEIQALGRLFEVNVAVLLPSTYEAPLSAAALLQKENASRIEGMAALSGATKKKKRAQPAWMNDEPESDEKKEPAEAILTGGGATASSKGTDTSTLHLQSSSSSSPSSVGDVLRETLKQGAQVFEMYNFDAKTAPLVTLSYHPNYHEGKHYNSVRRIGPLRSGNVEEEASPSAASSSKEAALPTVHSLAAHMKGCFTNPHKGKSSTSADPAGGDQSPDQKARKPKTARDIFG
ncbi:unnamed protein product [Amoebophrya sp. A25]|nr:unnamed protein product [Amoebophrya sp. A25]|eukprot:GSA25T00006010001.1